MGNETPKKIKKKKWFNFLSPHELKTSDIILKFAEPVLKVADDERTIKTALIIAIACWNLTSFPEDRHEELIVKMVKAITKTGQLDKDLESVVRMLIERKKLLFPHLNKFIVNHDIRFEDGKIIFDVEPTHL